MIVPGVFSTPYSALNLQVYTLQQDNSNIQSLKDGAVSTNSIPSTTTTTSATTTTSTTISDTTTTSSTTSKFTTIPGRYQFLSAENIKI